MFGLWGSGRGTSPAVKTNRRVQGRKLKSSFKVIINASTTRTKPAGQSVDPGGGSVGVVGTLEHFIWLPAARLEQ